MKKPGLVLYAKKHGIFISLEATEQITIIGKNQGIRPLHIKLSIDIESVI